MKLRILAVVVSLAAGFLLGCAATIRAAHPVGSAQSGSKPGYVVSYRYGDYWHNHFYEGA